MTQTVVDTDLICKLKPTLDEEESYGFMVQSCIDNWFIYNSDKLGVENVKALANNFMALHGTTFFPNKNEFFDEFWTSVPLGIFRYKMLADGTFYLVDSYKKIDGYIVEGVYWVNGFVCLVRDNIGIIQIKLFINEKTKNVQLYPDVE